MWTQYRWEDHVLPSGGWKFDLIVTVLVFASLVIGGADWDRAHDNSRESVAHFHDGHANPALAKSGGGGAVEGWIARAHSGSAAAWRCPTVRREES